MPRHPRTCANTFKEPSVNEETCELPVKYATGFKPPSHIETLKAIGFKKDIPVEYQIAKDGDDSGMVFFKPIPPPRDIDDWLAQYCEQGQTYKQFLEQCPWLSSRKRKYMTQTFLPSGKTIQEKYPDGKIYIVPVGNCEHEDPGLYQHLIEYTTIFLQLPVVLLPGIKLNIEEGKVSWVEEVDIKAVGKQRTSQRLKHHQLTTRFNAETQHLQVCVDGSLMQLRKLIPNDAICLIGLTMLDLYSDDSDLFVAGMAAGNHRVAIFSLYRYDPSLSFCTEHWFKVKEDKRMPKKDRQQIVLQRGCKLLVHEICHLLGIDHCIYFDCCMNGSGHLTEDFRQPMHMCPVDLHKLHTLVGFDIVNRYQLLMEFFKNQGFSTEEKWVQEILKNRQAGESDHIE